MSENIVYSGFRPGCLSTLCALQSTHYSHEWGFDHIYESVVASGVGEFLLRFDPSKDFVNLACIGETVKGGIVIDSRNGKEAQLRWFILDKELRGSGVGRQLIAHTMAFVTAQDFQKVYLTTFTGLDAAGHLYEAVGFNLVEEKIASTWGQKVMEQRYEWIRDSSSNEKNGE